MGDFVYEYFFFVLEIYAKIGKGFIKKKVTGVHMEKRVPIIDSRGIMDMVRRTFNEVDNRLIDHGMRVSYIVFKMAEKEKKCRGDMGRRLPFIALLHDIGAYKTEEIDKMVQFETGSVWQHSIYGYLFLKYFSPFPSLAPAVLFHHLPCERFKLLDKVSEDNQFFAQLIHLADRADMCFLEGKMDKDTFYAYLDRQEGKQFSGEVIDLLKRADIIFPLEKQMEEDEAFRHRMQDSSFSEEEVNAFLNMLIYAIDFRSSHTVTHTITTTSISKQTARLLGMDMERIRRVAYGALLHDLGKISIPVEILEFPGKLSPQAMNVMRTHVDKTEEILGDCVPEEILRIALRHHEKLDGSGYPRGLRAEELTVEERVVAIADIVSALCGTRSYKEAYSKDKTLGILEKMSSDGLIDSEITDLVVKEFDGIMAEVEENCRPILEVYYHVQKEYMELEELFRQYGF